MGNVSRAETRRAYTLGRRSRTARDQRRAHRGIGAFRQAHSKHFDCVRGPCAQQWDLFRPRCRSAMIRLIQAAPAANSKIVASMMRRPLRTDGPRPPGYTLAPIALVTEIVAEINAALDG